MTENTDKKDTDLLPNGKKPRLTKGGNIDRRHLNRPPPASASKARQRLSELLKKGKEVMASEQDSEVEEDIKKPLLDVEEESEVEPPPSQIPAKKKSKPIPVKEKSKKKPKRKLVVQKYDSESDETETDSESDSDNEVIVVKKKNKKKPTPKEKQGKSQDILELEQQIKELRSSFHDQNFDEHKKFVQNARSKMLLKF